ncbi:hypothetical protein [Saccharothrix sp. NRRL B-16314]|uniref:hypothetical protein n=1 Tax=Saccharothrix sp. NRRL B-16314 TaxID=1463825 RepID=UPI000527CD82|nr:hypothetical protein [Saccharothrix sp. NRRL B-16314]
MAVSDAVRRSGSALLRALAVGGLATAAWLACAGLASAGEDHPDEIAAKLDAVNVALGEQQAATADVPLADVLPLGVPALDVLLERPLERPLVVDERPFEVRVTSLLGEVPTDNPGAVYLGSPYSSPYASPYADPPSDDPYEDEYTHPGYTSGSSNYSHSGSVSNTMPAPLYEAKVATKAAARAAAAAPPPAVAPQPAPPAPTAVRVTALAGSDVPTTSASQASRTASNADVVWESPNPGAPAPTPNQAPAPSAPTASSSSSGADSGGGHRGGLIASFSSQSDLKPLAAWSTERRDGGRSPGSVPGLPSTSPD